MRESIKDFIRWFPAREKKMPSEFSSDSLGGGTGWQRMVFSPDGRRLAIVLNEAIQLLDTSSGKQIRRLAYGDLCDGNAVAFSQDGTLLALAGATVAGRKRVTGQSPLDDTVRLWDTRTGTLLWKAQEEDGPANSVALSPQGWVLVSGSKGGTIRLWEVATGLELL